MHACPAPVVRAYFFGLRFACARSDAIGPRSRFGVFGFRKSLPACDASRFEVVMVVFSFPAALCGSLWLTAGRQRL
jgi:hypothetical protein